METKVKFTREQLEKVREELNDVLGLKPPIPLSKTDKKLLVGIRKGIRYIDWETIDWETDEFSEEVADLINQIIEDWAEEYEKKEEVKKEVKKEEEKKSPKKRKITKKSVILDMISQDGGASIEEISQEIERLGIDPDHEKNLRIVRLWLHKMGYQVAKKIVSDTDKIQMK